MDIIDTHCHLDVEDFNADREQVIGDCRLAGVTRMVVPAIDAHGWDSIRRLCDNHPGLLPAYGLHPVYINMHTPAQLDGLSDWLTRHRPIAVGEVGLDYYVKGLDRDRQQWFFERQLQMAKDHDLPVLLHSRKAHDPVIAALKRSGVCGGIAHAFNGSLQQARQYIKLGFKLGFGGTLTYARANHIHQLARELPLDAIVLETDAPDMPGAAYRGQRNSPCYLPEYLHALAVLRDMEPATVAAQTTANAARVLGLL